jgi:hypothetical protein
MGHFASFISFTIKKYTAMSKWYKVNLLPLGPYFFGQELIAEQGNRQNYFKRSAAFPQQSTLLGMLRHQILLQHGLARPVVNKATVDVDGLIAHKGFEPETKAGRYGKIMNMSPVFLQQDGKGHYFIRDQEWVKKAGDKLPYSLTMFPGPSADLQELRFSSLSGESYFTPQLQCLQDGKKETELYTNKFKPKEFLVALEGHNKFGLDKVFGDATATGVYKFVSRGEQKEDDQNSAYFKNVSKWIGSREGIPKVNDLEETEICAEKEKDSKFFTLEREWTFGFYVEMEDDATLATSERRVAIMGKERSAFLVEITDQGIDNKWMQPQAGADLQKVVLLSDAFVDEAELLKHTVLITGSTVRFRSFTKAYNEDRHFSHANLDKGMKSACHHLLKRGTVIYTKKAPDVAKLLVGETNWRTIGNNYFMILPA